MSNDEILAALESAKCMDAFECIFCMYGMNEDGVYGCFAKYPDGKPGESKGCVAHQAAGAIRLLEAENTKLRELLAETLMDVHEYAEKYGIESSYDAVNEHLDARLRELGVEV